MDTSNNKRSYGGDDLPIPMIPIQRTNPFPFIGYPSQQNDNHNMPIQKRRLSTDYDHVQGNNGDDLPIQTNHVEENDDADRLIFSLLPTPTPPSQVAPPQTAADLNNTTVVGGRIRTQPRRNNNRSSPAAGKSETISPRYDWATDRRATVHTISYLHSKQIYTIKGDVQCKKCDKTDKIEFNLEEKFTEISNYIAENKDIMHQRAPKTWLSPALLNCRLCNQENCVRPVVEPKKRNINWLFMFLGQMLGCCTLDQLKYFCKHTKNHRTGAKDRVLFLAYLGLCKQLDPNGPFDIDI